MGKHAHNCITQCFESRLAPHASNAQGGPLCKRGGCIRTLRTPPAYGLAYCHPYTYVVAVVFGTAIPTSLYILVKGFHTCLCCVYFCLRSCCGFGTAIPTSLYILVMFFILACLCLFFLHNSTLMFPVQ